MNETKIVDWEIRNWAVQLVFCLGCIVLFIINMMREDQSQTAWFWFWLVLGWFAIASFNCARKQSWMRHVIMLMLCASCAVIYPMAVFSLTSHILASAVTGIAFVMVTVLVSPLDITIAVLLVGGCWAWYQRTFFLDAGESLSLDQTLRLVGTYIALVSLATCWRMLIRRLYLALSGAMAVESGQQTAHALADKIQILEKERDILKEQLALHILEMTEMSEQLKETP